jgi:hypothetical protein
MSTNTPIICGGTGIKNSHKRTVGRLLDTIERQSARQVKHVRYYPPAQAWNAKRSVERVADVIAESTPAGAHYIGHSWNGNPLHEAMKNRGLTLGTIILFAPAMPVNTDWHGCNFQRLICVHNPQDKAVKMGLRLRRLAGLVGVDHPFGAAGLWGFNERDDMDRIENINVPDLDGRWNHSDYFYKDLAFWAEFCLAQFERTDNYKGGGNV